MGGISFVLVVWLLEIDLFGHKPKFQEYDYFQTNVFDTQTAPEGYQIKLLEPRDQDSLPPTVHVLIQPEDSPIPALFDLGLLRDSLLAHKHFPYFLHHHLLILRTRNGKNTQTLHAFSMCDGSKKWERNCEFYPDVRAVQKPLTQIALRPDSALTWWTQGPRDSVIFYVADLKTGQIRHRAAYPWLNRMEEMALPQTNALGGWIVGLHSADGPDAWWMHHHILAPDLTLVAAPETSYRENARWLGRKFYYAAFRSPEIVEIDMLTGEKTAEWKPRYPTADGGEYTSLLGAWEDEEELVFWMQERDDNYFVRTSAEGQVRMFREEFMELKKFFNISISSMGWTQADAWNPYAGDLPDFLPFSVSTRVNDESAYAIAIWDTREDQFYYSAPVTGGVFFSNVVIFRNRDQIWGSLSGFSSGILLKFSPDSPEILRSIDLGNVGYGNGIPPVRYFHNMTPERLYLRERWEGEPMEIDLNSMRLVYPPQSDSLAPDNTAEIIDAFRLPPDTWKIRQLAD